MLNRPVRRTVTAPDPGGSGRYDVYQDAPDGLVWLSIERTLSEALAAFPGAVVLSAVWDAPVIDPADPETYPGDLRRLSWY